jgi:methionyl-tRNA formyltransferase
MNLVFLGSGEFGLACLDVLAQSRHNVPLVVTQPPHAAGRGRKPRPTSVAQWASEHAIAYLEAEDVNGPEVIDKIGQVEPDLIVVIAFGQKIGRRVMDVPTSGAINVHASLLPRYRGAAPINWAIINGEKETGISVIILSEKMDAGHILAQQRTQILPDETAGELHDRLAEMAAPLLIETIDQIEAGTATYREQDHSRATLAPKLKKTDGYVDFSEPAEILARKIRGFWPWPGAAAMYVSHKSQKSLRVTLARARVVRIPNSKSQISNSRSEPLPPGTLDENLCVICGCDALRIEELKPAGGRLMKFADFVNGWHVQPGDFFRRIE